MAALFFFRTDIEAGSPYLRGFWATKKPSGDGGSAVTGSAVGRPTELRFTELG
jgi:hypothetical protein